jgi:hypothetical protein
MLGLVLRLLNPLSSKLRFVRLWRVGRRQSSLYEHTGTTSLSSAAVRAKCWRGLTITAVDIQPLMLRCPLRAYAPVGTRRMFWGFTVLELPSREEAAAWAARIAKACRCDQAATFGSSAALTPSYAPPICAISSSHSCLLFCRRQLVQGRAAIATTRRGSRWSQTRRSRPPSIAHGSRRPRVGLRSGYGSTIGSRNSLLAERTTSREWMRTPR